MRQVGDARKKAERDPRQAHWVILAEIINVLRDCVSLIQQHQHESLLAEVLGIKLWSTGPVSTGRTRPLLPPTGLSTNTIIILSQLHL